MAENKGHCKHGEFVLTEGCPQCIAERQDSADNSAVVEVALPPGTDQEVMTYHDEAQRLQQYAEARIIKTAEDAKTATDDLSIIANLKKAMEDKRKEYLVPLQEQVKTVNETYKMLMEPILSADQITRSKLLGYRQEQERIRQQQEEINRKRLEAAEAEMKLKGELTESVDLVEVAPEAPKAVSTNLGTAGQRDNWKYEVVSFSELPDEYKIADTAMLNSIAKRHHDQKQIPGVRFYNEPIIAVRAR